MIYAAPRAVSGSVVLLQPGPHWGPRPVFLLKVTGMSVARAAVEAMLMSEGHAAAGAMFV